jgi:catechol 2,3-dioxygenase-like lactoylglutathione lyase family enzyme
VGTVGDARMSRPGPEGTGERDEEVWVKQIVVVAALAALASAGSVVAAEAIFTDGTIHVGLVVKDLDASIAFYTSVIGMTKTGGFQVDAAMGKASGLTGGLPFGVTILKLRNDPHAAELKLMSFDNDAKAPKSTHIQEALGIRYITLKVDDLTPLIGRIKAAGVPLLGETPIPLGVTGQHLALIQDPDGTFIEMVGPER